MTGASSQCLFGSPRHPTCIVVCQGYHLNAIDRAGGKAKVAAGTVFGRNRMHLLVGTNNGIDRASLHAQSASNAKRFINLRNMALTF